MKNIYTLLSILIISLTVYFSFDDLMPSSVKSIETTGFSVDNALNHLKVISKKSLKNGKPLIEDPVFSSEVAELEIDLLAMEIFNIRTVSAAAEGKAPGMESSLLKIKGTLVRQKTTELLRKALGPQALPYLPEQFDEGWNEMPIGPDYAGPIAKQYFNMRKISIYGGSNEIQKNIVAKASFGL